MHRTLLDPPAYFSTLAHLSCWVGVVGVDGKSLRARMRFARGQCHLVQNMGFIAFLVPCSALGLTAYYIADTGLTPDTM